MSATLQNDTFLRACLRQPTDYTPVWLMRQAGRYLPEYRETRAKAGSFMGLATNRDYATEVTLQPLQRYKLDAAILFSDILTVPDAMGLGLSFALGEGPKFERHVRDEAAVAALAVPDMNKLRYVFDAVSSIRKALNGSVPLIGFSGSPWTLACYMVEGGGSDDYRQVKSLMYARPDLMHRILSVNAEAVAQYLNAQIEAGAQAVMLFDSWGGVLADGAFQRFSLDYSRRVLAQVKTEHEGRRIPRIVCAARCGARAGAGGVGQFWQSAPRRWQLGRTCFQSGPWHQPVHAARPCNSPGRRGSCPFAPPAQRRLIGCGDCLSEREIFTPGSTYPQKMTRGPAAIELLRRSSVFSRISRKYLIFKGFQLYAAGLLEARLLTLDGRSWGALATFPTKLSTDSVIKFKSLFKSCT